MAELSDQEMLRYNRQIILRGFDFDGQEALKDSRVLIVGLGGLRLRSLTVSGKRRCRQPDAARLRHGFALKFTAPNAAQRCHSRAN